MRARWVGPAPRSWRSGKAATLAEADACLRLIKAARISAGGRVVGAEVGPSDIRFRDYAVLRATAALDRYARATYGVASFEALARKLRNAQDLTRQLEDAVRHTRDRATPGALSRDTLFQEFEEWEAMEAVGERLTRRSPPLFDVALLQDSDYVRTVAARFLEAKREILVAVG